MNFFRRIWEDSKAFFRGERRISKASHGRIYGERKTREPHIGPAGPVGGDARAKATATMTMVVTKADGTVVKHTRPAEFV